MPDQIAVPGDLQDILVAVQRPATGGTQELDTCRETFDENIKVKAHIAKLVVQGFYAMVEAAEYHATPGLHPRHTLEAKKAFVRLAADLAFLGDTRLPSSDQNQLR